MPFALPFRTDPLDTGFVVRTSPMQDQLLGSQFSYQPCPASFDRMCVCTLSCMTHQRCACAALSPQDQQQRQACQHR